MDKLFRECLVVGMNGIDVLVLQVYLVGAEKAVPGFIPDGKYGQMTARSVMALRLLAGLPPDEGRFGPRLREALKQGIIPGVPTIDFDSIPFP